MFQSSINLKNFDTERTEKTKAGNRVSAEKKDVLPVIVENLGGN